MSTKPKLKVSHSATVLGRGVAYPPSKRDCLPMSSAPGSVSGGQVLKLLDLGFKAQDFGVEKLGQISAKLAHDTIKEKVQGKNSMAIF